MVFLPGDHVLNTNVTVANVAGLTMRGKVSSGRLPQVVCSGPVGFLFDSMIHFKLHSLAFTSCSRAYIVPQDLIELALGSQNAIVLLQIFTQSMP